MIADLFIHSASQLVTCASDGPKRGEAMRDVGIVHDGAIAIRGEKIVAVGKTNELRKTIRAKDEIDASGKVICPGFVDPHTHVVFAGDRVNEFEMKLRGAAYLDILAAGGGIVSTMHATRDATLDQLVNQTSRRLDEMIRIGTLTVESKTGYGLNLETEIKQLEAMKVLNKKHAIDIVPTFLGAHTTPPEFKGREGDYVDLILNEILPAFIKSLSTFNYQLSASFIDIFCERSAFSVDQAQRVLQAGKKGGLGVKAHVDQFNDLGGVPMALELGAISVDHLDVTSLDNIKRIAKTNTVAVVIPTVNFNLGSCNFANARAMIDEGCVLALCTDLNPGSAPCPSMPMAMAIACRYQKLSPAEAFNASTINAAHAICLGHRVGSLEVGKQADVLIIDATDYRHLAYQFGGNLVQTVIKRGVPFA
jgi:imidazolonepropionase